ncbi:hypothetical protein Sjap_004707 [Stephania japonica]|uniref:FAD linked oxidase N-terminal domain-containing protein n=1 Tax=Stephania japonica TaxID=461633 RepID=A0AAP0PJC0_9MAGN
MGSFTLACFCSLRSFPSLSKTITFKHSNDLGHLWLRRLPHRLRRRDLLLLPTPFRRQAQESPPLPLRPPPRRPPLRLQPERHPPSPHRVFLQPETPHDLEALVGDANRRSEHPPVGSGLSPNGIGCTQARMVNLALMDRVIEVDGESMRVRVQPGLGFKNLLMGSRSMVSRCEISRPFASGQIGGIIQVSLYMDICTFRTRCKL